LEGQDCLLLAMAADSLNNYETTYLNTAINVAKSCDSFTKHILYTGSTSVYGDHQGSLVDESTLPLPTNMQAQILLKTEEMLLNIPSTNVCIYRLGEIIGPGRQIVDRLKNLKRKTLPGNGGAPCNLIELQEIVLALDFALKHQLKGIYNLCNDLHLSRRELYAQLCHEYDLPAVLWDPSLPKIHGGSKIASNQKIKLEGFTFSN
jgi:nucleoside-diphosphate-sugar epimerase